MGLLVISSIGASPVLTKSVCVCVFVRGSCGLACTIVGKLKVQGLSVQDCVVKDVFFKNPRYTKHLLLCKANPNGSRKRKRDGGPSISLRRGFTV